MGIKQSIFVKQDTGIIVDRIRKSTRELEQGPVGKNLSSVEKRKFLVNTVCSDSIDFICLCCLDRHNYDVSMMMIHMLTMCL